MTPARSPLGVFYRSPLGVRGNPESLFVGGERFYVFLGGLRIVIKADILTSYSFRNKTGTYSTANKSYGFDNRDMATTWGVTNAANLFTPSTFFKFSPGAWQYNCIRKDPPATGWGLTLDQLDAHNYSSTLMTSYRSHFNDTGSDLFENATGIEGFLSGQYFMLDWMQITLASYNAETQEAAITAEVRIYQNMSIGGGDFLWVWVAKLEQTWTGKFGSMFSKASESTTISNVVYDYGCPVVKNITELSFSIESLGIDISPGFMQQTEPSSSLIGSGNERKRYFYGDSLSFVAAKNARGIATRNYDNEPSWTYGGKKKTYYLSSGSLSVADHIVSYKNAPLSQVGNKMLGGDVEVPVTLVRLSSLPTATPSEGTYPKGDKLYVTLSVDGYVNPDFETTPISYIWGFLDGAYFYPDGGQGIVASGTTIELDFLDPYDGEYRPLRLLVQAFAIDDTYPPSQPGGLNVYNFSFS